MGLDIYLYTSAEEHATNAREAAWEELYARFERGEITEDERTALVSDLPSYSGNTDVASQLHPDVENINNRRYLCSSYNEGGFNRAVPRFTGDDSTDYYSIFEPVIKDRDEPYLTHLLPEHIPALREVASRALEVAALIRSGDATSVTTFDAIAITDPSREHLWPTPPGESEALLWYREEARRLAERRASPDYKPDPFGDSGWSNAKGTFLGPAASLRVLGAVPGRDILGRPAVHVIYEANPSVKESYAVSADIVSEFCEEAIALIEADGECFMHWSG